MSNTTSIEKNAEHEYSRAYQSIGKDAWGVIFTYLDDASIAGMRLVDQYFRDFASKKVSVIRNLDDGALGVAIGVFPNATRMDLSRAITIRELNQYAKSGAAKRIEHLSFYAPDSHDLVGLIELVGKAFPSLKSLRIKATHGQISYIVHLTEIICKTWANMESLELESVLLTGDDLMLLRMCCPKLRSIRWLGLYIRFGDDLALCIDNGPVIDIMHWFQVTDKQMLLWLLRHEVDDLVDVVIQHLGSEFVSEHWSIWRGSGRTFLEYRNEHQGVSEMLCELHADMCF
jgi:hypothetical protein